MPLPDSVFLACPQCVDEGRGGIARMGNQRTKCTLCNRFQQAVLRKVSRALMDADPKVTAELKTHWEHLLHPKFADGYREATYIDPDDIEFDEFGQVIT